MSLDDRPFCRIHLDHRGPTEEIEQLVAALLRSVITFEGVTNDQLEILVDHGDSCPPIQERDYSQWINWKYSLEVFPALDGVDETQFAVPLRELLGKLHETGVKVVPSCDFEELLTPWNYVNASN